MSGFILRIIAMVTMLTDHIACNLLDAGTLSTIMRSIGRIALETHYKTLVGYNRFEDKGMILGYGCGTTSMTNNSKYIKEAYELGKSL